MSPHQVPDLSNAANVGSEPGSSDHQIQDSHGGVLNTEFLIIGAGPAGAALACFLASMGELLYSLQIGGSSSD